MRLSWIAALYRRIVRRQSHRLCKTRVRRNSKPSGPDANRFDGGHQDKAPTNALIAQAVKSCAERGLLYLWYANMSYGKKLADGLADFKRHNGFEKIELPRYYVPLTVAGRLALRLGLHHGMSHLIPESVAAAYRKSRKQWYGTKLSGPENA